MGLGPRGDGRAGRRRAGPMTTAILFGFLIFGGWRRGPPPQPRASRRRARWPARAAADDQGAKKYGCGHRSSAASRPRTAVAVRSQAHGNTRKTLRRRSACPWRLWGVF